MLKLSICSHPQRMQVPSVNYLPMRISLIRYNIIITILCVVQIREAFKNFGVSDSTTKVAVIQIGNDKYQVNNKD